MEEHRWPLSPRVVACEMARVAGVEDQLSQIVRMDDGRTFWWCHEHAVEVHLNHADLIRHIDVFSREVCEPAVQRWRAREGADRQPFDVLGAAWMVTLKTSSRHV